MIVALNDPPPLARPASPPSRQSMMALLQALLESPDPVSHKMARDLQILWLASGDVSPNDLRAIACLGSGVSTGCALCPYCLRRS